MTIDTRKNPWVPFPKKNRVVRLVKEHQTEVLTAAIVVLAVKNRGLRKDVQKLAAASHLIIDGTRRMDNELAMVQVDIDTLFGYVNSLDMDVIEHGNKLSEVVTDIHNLKQTKQDLFTQFFGERKV